MSEFIGWMNVLNRTIDEAEALLRQIPGSRLPSAFVVVSEEPSGPLGVHVTTTLMRFGGDDGLKSSIVYWDESDTLDNSQCLGYQSIRENSAVDLIKFAACIPELIDVAVGKSDDVTKAAINAAEMIRNSVNSRSN